MTAASTLRRRGRSAGLVALLGGAMVTATYPQGALSVVSSFVIDEFGVSRSELGAAFTAFSLTGAAVSPLMGAFTDKQTTRVLAALFGLGAVGLLLIATAPTFLVVLAGCVVGGLALGAGNPVTNRVIAERISVTRRGLVVGLKQAGPPLGLLVSGVLLPPLALAAGWRWALAASVVVPLAGLVATPFLVGRAQTPPDLPPAQPPEEQRAVRSVVLWLTVIGMGVALSLSGVIAFVPLYAQERVGVTAATAGSLAAVMGLSGVVGRVAWGSLGGRFRRPSTALIVITVVAVAATIALAAGEWLGVWVVWLGVLGTGGSMLAWHAVAWLVIIQRVGTGGVGKASGVMQVGNSVGFAGGPLMVGAIVDATASYTLAWAVIAGLLLLAGALTVWVRLRGGGSPSSGPQD